jgi:hypothetical protein
MGRRRLSLMRRGKDSKIITEIATSIASSGRKPKTMATRKETIRALNDPSSDLEGLWFQRYKPVFLPTKAAVGSARARMKREASAALKGTDRKTTATPMRAKNPAV